MSKRLFIILIIVSLMLVGCKKVEPFYLEEKYYQTNSLIDLDKETFKELITNKESFAIFIYQPLCFTSADFEKILNNYTDKHQIGIYKMSFSNMKKTSMKKKVKYYPSLIIFKDGEIIDYLKADSKKDKKCYKNEKAFDKWFQEYVILNK